ncbi:hypothetical protein CEUSTIGMA_g8603.t1 [Chlamydomonas eustigma]|uniref:YHYH domain-containing protein n=1 Tax=Chlamydomonas eustigma TaxID=1157962 RepID=A0A250XEH1_9CHLO|nr:hypothetical protein CEUSTIGMA_g8603.t1 [Chlamydomonas eustigma]|eukprot:GAX81170.1 hypothetical protein CEUSTIGMA_g8603.t1 [Chlamydomonas eustigma]
MQCSATNCSTVWSASTISTSSTGSNIVIKTESCPGYDWKSESDPNPAVVQSSSLTFPATPNIQSQPFVYVGIYGADNKSAPYPSSGYVMGAIGVATNGVVIYGNANLDGSNAFEQEAYSFDTCGGHASPTGDQYHYHQQTAPGCLASFTNVAGQHSSIFGLMMDGVAIFGPLGDKGVVPTDLDQCQGHVDTTYPFYHYHLPYNWAFPYTTACLRGCVSKANWNNVPSSVICSSSSSQIYTLSSDFSSVVGLFKAAAQDKTAQAPTIKFLTYVAETAGINTTGFASGAPSSGSSSSTTSGGPPSKSPISASGPPSKSPPSASGPPSKSPTSTSGGPPSKSPTSTSGGPPSKSPTSTSRGPPSGSSSTAGGPPSKSPTAGRGPPSKSQNSTSGGPPSGSLSTAGGPPSKSPTAGGPPSKSQNSTSGGPPSGSSSTAGGPPSKSPTSTSGGPPSSSSSISSGGPPSSSSSILGGAPPSGGSQPSGGATPSGGSQNGGGGPSSGGPKNGGGGPQGGRSRLKLF